MWTRRRWSSWTKADGDTITAAQSSAYMAIDLIKWENGFCRRDIGWRAVEREKG